VFAAVSPTVELLYLPPGKPLIRKREHETGNGNDLEDKNRVKHDLDSIPVPVLRLCSQYITLSATRVPSHPHLFE
jgi:hypothetical protein